MTVTLPNAAAEGNARDLNGCIAMDLAGASNNKGTAVCS